MKRYVAVLALLAGVAAYGLLNPPINLALGRGVLTRVPERIGDWNGTELSFENAVVEELRADDLLVRRYERGSDVVWLCVVYHQNRRYGAHDPRLCYESQGYLIEDEHDGHIAAPDGGEIPARWFTAERTRSPRLVAYWWTTAGLVTIDRDAFRRQMAVRGALDNRSWGAFVRVETELEPGREAAAARRLSEFAADVARVLPDVFADSTSGNRPS